MTALDHPPLQRLYPADSERYEPLSGLYLKMPLPEGRDGLPWVYANFVTSLDGRISLDHGGSGCRVPGAIANPRDWRLFQELAARADCLLTSGRYLRELAAGCAQDILPLGAGFTELQRWRQARGLPPQPDVAVVSGTLDFEIPPALLEQGRRVWLFAPQGADPGRLERHRRAGAAVAARTLGPQARGREICQALGSLGYQRVYSVAGPQIARTLIDDGSLDALFQTVRHRVLGGSQGAFETVVEGPALTPPAAFQLTSLYLDPGDRPGASQHFLRLDRVGGDAP